MWFPHIYLIYPPESFQLLMWNLDSANVKQYCVLPAVLAWVRYVTWVSSFSDVTAHFAVSVWRQQSPGSHHQTQTVVKCVSLFWPILGEETVA